MRIPGDFAVVRTMKTAAATVLAAFIWAVMLVSPAAAVLEIVGIFDSGVPDIDRNIAEMPLGAFQDMFYMEGAGHQVVVFGESLREIPVLHDRIRGLLPDGEDLAVHDWDALQPGLKQAIQADISSAFFMYGVLVILVAFSVLNTSLMSVLERTHEFGVAMALGNETPFPTPTNATGANSVQTFNHPSANRAAMTMTVATRMAFPLAIMNGTPSRWENRPDRKLPKI